MNINEINEVAAKVVARLDVLNAMTPNKDVYSEMHRMRLTLSEILKLRTALQTEVA